MGGSFGRGTYMFVVASDDDANAVFLDMPAQRTFEGRGARGDSPDKVFTASSFTCRRVDSEVRIFVTEYEPDGDLVAARTGQVTIAASPPVARIEWFEPISGSPEAMADQWTSEGWCPLDY